MKHLFSCIIALFLSAILFSQTSKSRKMESKKILSIVVFGDGLNDMGRWGKMTNYQYPPAAHGFYESRWTNGKVWVELLAEKLKLKIDLTNNLAMGGATTGYYNINEPLRGSLQLNESVKLEGMLAQVNSYLQSKPTISENTLFVLWAGGHDIGNYLEYGQPDLIKNPPAANYSTAISLLVKNGAKNIMFGTMPDMGYTPVYFGTEKQTRASELCNQLNQGLDQIVLNYNAQSVRIIKLDGAKIFTEVGMNAAKYGFRYTEPFLPYNIIDFSNPLKKVEISIPNKEKGLNSDEFMNWWAVSASAKMHQIIADRAFETLTIK